MYEYDQNTLKEMCTRKGISLAPYPKGNVLFTNALQHAGLIWDDLNTLNVPYYHNDYALALKCLICEKNLSIPDAIAEIQNLYPEQARGLAELYTFGIRGHHLRSFQIDPIEYTPHHTESMWLLIQEHHYSIVDAVAFASNRTMDEVQEVYSMRPSI